MMIFVFSATCSNQPGVDLSRLRKAAGRVCGGEGLRECCEKKVSEVEEMPKASTGAAAADASLELVESDLKKVAVATFAETSSQTLSQTTYNQVHSRPIGRSPLSQKSRITSRTIRCKYSATFTPQHKRNQGRIRIDQSKLSCSCSYLLTSHLP